MENTFNFEIVPVSKPLNVWKTEQLTKDRWGNLFYAGMWPEKKEKVRCVTQCKRCYDSWFNLRIVDFDKNYLEDLAKSGLIDNATIIANQMAEGDDNDSFYNHKTKLELTAQYVQVRCNKRNSLFLVILDFGETQPGLYHGQLQGVWPQKNQ